MKKISGIRAFLLSMFFMLVFAFPSYAAQVTLNSPNGGSLKRGYAYLIKWTYSGAPGAKIKLLLLRNGIKLGTIADNLDASAGMYKWQKAGTYLGGGPAPFGGGYRVKVKVKGTNVSDSSDQPFSITIPHAQLKNKRNIPRPDFHISSLNGECTKVTQKKVSIEGVLENSAVATAVPARLAVSVTIFYLKNPGSKISQTATLMIGPVDIPVQAGFKGTMSFKRDLAFPPSLNQTYVKDFIVHAVADPDNSVPEENEANNQRNSPKTPCVFP